MQPMTTTIGKIQLKDKVFRPYLSEEIIFSAVAEMAEKMNNELRDKNPLFIVVLNGSFMFASDLFKQINLEAEISFIKIASYQGMRSTGQVVTSIGMEQDLHGRDLIIVEDIVDTGLTLHWLKSNLESRGAKSVEILTMLRKPEAAKVEVDVKYVGFDIPTDFVIGYGLDFDEKYRNLDFIGVLAKHVYA